MGGMRASLILCGRSNTDGLPAQLGMATHGMPPFFMPCARGVLHDEALQACVHACRRIVEQSLELYTCSAGAVDSEVPAVARNATQPKAYNELATLMSVTGEQSLASAVRPAYGCVS